MHTITQPPASLSTRSNEILTAVVQGARREEPSHEVQGAAISALLNSLEFIRDNFEREVSEENKIQHLRTKSAHRANAITSCKWFVKLLRVSILPFK
jgi:importin subunit beta-1